MELVRVSQAGPKLEEVRALFLEYAQTLGFSLCFQGFDAELAGLPGAYAPPRGSLLLAQGRGCVAVRPLDGATAEMKRLYVRDAARGTGLGRRLAQAAIGAAREGGYQRMVLDTVAGKMDAAIALYRALGFREIAPYTVNPVPGAFCMELPLR
jgi:ribosomal protein S18 acetylase RimI-like enzyme